jgi:hypothetical protein
MVTLKFFDEFKYFINKRNKKIVKSFLLAVKIQDPLQTFIFNVAVTRVSFKKPAEKTTRISFKQILFLLKPPSSFRPGILFLAEARDLVFLQKFKTRCGSYPAPYSMDTGVYFPLLRRPGDESALSHPSGIEVAKNE